jgi:hypothetical protein
MQLINLQDFTSTALPTALGFRGRSIIAAVGDRIMRIGAWRSRARRLRTAGRACAAGQSELGVLFRSVDVLNVGLIGASVRGAPRRALPDRARARLTVSCARTRKVAVGNGSNWECAARAYRPCATLEFAMVRVAPRQPAR